MLRFFNLLFLSARQPQNLPLRAQLHLLRHIPQTKQTPGLSPIDMQLDPHCSILPIAFVCISTLPSTGRHREVACIWKQI